MARISPTATSSTAKKMPTVWRLPNCSVEPTGANTEMSPNFLPLDSGETICCPAAESAARPAATLWPSCRRPTSCTAATGPVESTSGISIRLSGKYTSGASPNPAIDRESAGSTPNTVYGTPLKMSVLPNTPGSPPRRCCQNRNVITAMVGSRSACASAAVNPRPNANGTPMTSKKLAATTIGIRLMVWSGPRQLTLLSMLKPVRPARAPLSSSARHSRCET